MTVTRFPGPREPDAPLIEGKAGSIPMIGNLHMPHVWDEDRQGGVCKRCGASWPDRDNCP